MLRDKKKREQRELKAREGAGAPQALCVGSEGLEGTIALK